MTSKNKTIHKTAAINSGIIDFRTRSVSLQHLQNLDVSVRQKKQKSFLSFSNTYGPTPKFFRYRDYTVYLKNEIPWAPPH